MDVSQAPGGFFPDPLLTASVYCAGSLDKAIFQAVRPFWREFRAEEPELTCYLWLVRYGKGGEHLKVRIHGSEQLLSRLRSPLEEKISAFLDSLTEPASLAGEWGHAPPIDAEDRVDTDHPDRTFLWTTYRRSHVSLAGEPLLSDDQYAWRLTRCLAEASEIVLSLEPGEDGRLPDKVRRNTLLKASIAGLAAVDLPLQQRIEYLSYHRDWLLRFVRPRTRESAIDPTEHLLKSFEAHVGRMGSSLHLLQKSIQAAWSSWNEGRETPSRPNDLVASWQRALAELLEHIAPVRSDSAYCVDPFAGDVAFAPIFKVLHGFANQLGLDIANEALIYHTLLRAASPRLALERGAA